MNRILIQTAAVALLSSSAYAQNSNGNNSQPACDRQCEIDIWIFVTASVLCCIIVVLSSIYYCCVRPAIMREERRLRKPPNPESPESIDIEAQDFGRPSFEGPHGPPPRYTPLNATIDPKEINAPPCYSPPSFSHPVPPPPAHTTS